MRHAVDLGTFLKQQRQALRHETRWLGACERLPARIGRPVTQEEVAEALEVSRTWYALLESGTVRASAALANRIATVFALDAIQRLELFRLAVPGLGVASPTGDGAPDVAPWAFPFPRAETLVIGSPNEIEETARALALAREHFLVSGDVLLTRARKRILNSWLRSRALVDASCRIAPLAVSRDAQLDDLRAANERLLRAAAPLVHYLAEHLAGSGYVVVITDEHGRILELHGDADARRHLKRIEFAPGGDWSEAAAGTNAIGTALADGRPLQLMAAEHFCDGWQALTCTAAPIHDPETRAIVGAIDVTSGYRLIRADLLALIMQYALEIEERLAPATEYSGSAFRPIVV
jgi:DNA-binding XRE family transcriptional regulator